MRSNNHRSRAVGTVLAVLITTGLAAVSCSGPGGSGGPGSQAIEAVVCKSASNKACDKWFSCWPVISADFWVSLADCKLVMQAWCNDAGQWAECPVDNDSLQDCDDKIADSKCGSLPASCVDMRDCYEDSQ